jgi:hypothetical protein
VLSGGIPHNHLPNFWLLGEFLAEVIKLFAIMSRISMKTIFILQRLEILPS